MNLYDFGIITFVYKIKFNPHKKRNLTALSRLILGNVQMRISVFPELLRLHTYLISEARKSLYRLMSVNEWSEGLPGIDHST